MENPLNEDMLNQDVRRTSSRVRVGTDDFIPGAREERLYSKKQRRSAAKSALTRGINNLETLIYNYSYNDSNEVREKFYQLQELLCKFRNSHDAYHAELIDEYDLEESQNYFNQEEQLFLQKNRQFENWLVNAEMSFRANFSDEVAPEDSVSNVGSLYRKSKVSSVNSSTSSRRSLASSAASSRLKAAARKAALEAKAASLRSLHELQKEEICLKQRKEELEIKSKIAEAQAEERVFSEAEALERGDFPRGSHVDFVPLDQHLEFTQKPKVLSGIEDDDLPKASVKETKASVKETKASDKNKIFQVWGSDDDKHNNSVVCKGLPAKTSLLLPFPETNKVGFPVVKPKRIISDEVKSEKVAFGESSHLDIESKSASQFLVDLQRQQNEQLQKVLIQQQQQMFALTLPQTSVPVFGGDPAEYCTFIRAFETLIEAKTPSNSARLYYLVQFTQGDVQELMRSCLLMSTEEGYAEARRLLKAKFGQNHKIASAYLNKVVEGPSIKAEDGIGLQKFAVLLTSCKNTLKDIGLLNKIENPDVMQKIVGRLPFRLKLQWRDVADRISEVDEREISIEDLAKFVEKKARAATHPVFGNIPDAKISSHNKGRFEVKSHKGSAFVAQTNEAENIADKISSTKADCSNIIDSPPESRKPTCPLCHNFHWLSQCNQFRKMSVDDRRSFVKANALCNNCLASGHFVKSCEKKSFCKVSGCKTKHSTFLHPKSQSCAIVVENPEREVQGQNSCVHVDTGDAIGAGTTVPPRCTIGMAIVPVKVRAIGQDDFIETYAFLDSGSNTTFCSELLLSQLGVKGVHTKLSLTTIEKSNSTRECSTCSLEVFDLNENESVHLPLVFSVHNLPVSVKDIPLQEEVNKWKHLAGVVLPSISAHVGLLIGCDVPKALEPREFKRSKNRGPFAVRTMFGWVINGPLSRSENYVDRKANFVRVEENLSKQFEQFCNMEFSDSVFDNSSGMSRQDLRAMEIFEKSAELVDGHYSVAIPWKSLPPDLPNNKSVAVRRLQYLKKKLSNDPETLHKYSAFMEELFQKGYARKVPNDEIDRDDDLVWYLPHHNVVHPQKPGKTRVVFDCAAKFKGVSLNDRVLQGPDLTNSLVGVLTRFRIDYVAFMADIESMFYQVRVPSDDVDALRFLWFPNGDLNQEPEEYQMCVHLFGGVWSPSCANFALLKTAQDNRDLYDPEVAETVEKNFYVDDCLKSVNTDDRAVELIDQLRQMLSSGGFKLRKFISNSRKVLESLPVSERVEEVRDLDLQNDALPIERALGVRWDTETDMFTFKIVVKEKSSTRRGLLSIISSVYDPLGFVSPFVLPAKFILQELCRRKLDWDDEIPDDLLARWKRWICELPRLEEFRLNRCFTPLDFGEIVRRELHHFSDASESGYGAVSYLRSVNADGRIHCSFVQSKSRLAPLKQVTIPRLELAAAVVSSRLDRMIRKDLDIVIDESVFWTDSTCVLGYINNDERRFKTYVANRVSAILEVSSPYQWRYIDTKLNPGDDASRGLTAEDLIRNDRWKDGPQFLCQSKSFWPEQPDVKVKISEDDSELKKEASSLSTLSSVSQFNIVDLFKRFSSWIKLKKFVAWMLRFRSLLRDLVTGKKDKMVCSLAEKRNLKPVSVRELNEAEVAIIKFVQRESFKDELSDVSMNKSAKKNSSIYKLDPVMTNGLLCLGGRLKHAPINDNAKHPVILPKKHHVVDLIVRNYHVLAGHSGVEYVLSLIRSKFWIVKGRVIVRKILNNCFECRKRQAPVGQQRMADLPEDRVTPNKPPFSFTGVDCFGPFIVRRGRSQVKRYGVLFTCLSIRAVHLEVAHGLDTDSFLNALRRFIARRGSPERIRSDNGSNFVSGERELREEILKWNQKKIHDYLSQRTVKWIFNPPTGSHHGGVWERCIRTVRKVIRAIVKVQVLDDDGLSTLFCEVESIVNGRPITKVSDDHRDMEALTPNHLLLLRGNNLLPPGSFSREDIYSRKKWRQVQYLADLFWRRWTREYLPALQQRQKWIVPRRNFMVGDIVLLVDNNTPRGSWPLGRILEVHCNSKDGFVRTVTVKTKSSVLQRPISKLVLLEGADFVAS